MRKSRFLGVVVLFVIFAIALPAYGQAGAPNPGASRANIFIQNIQASGNADLVLTFTRGADVSIAPASFNYNVLGLVPGASKSLLYTTCWQASCTTGTNVPDGWAGAVEIASSAPLATIVNMFWTGIPSAGTYSGVGVPNTTIYMPNLLKTSSRRTVVSVQNTGATDANGITMVYYNRNGAAVFTDPTVSIPARSVRRFDLSTIAGVDFSATAGTGSLKITHGTNKLAAVASIHYPAGDRGTAVYSGFSAGSTKVWFLSQFRRYSGATPTLYNANIVQNLGASAANVTVNFIGKAAGNLTTSCTDTIQPGASQGYNMTTQGTAPAGCWNAMQSLGINWVGTVTVQSTNSQPLAGVGFYFSTTNVKDVLGFEAMPDAQASNRIYSPAVYRKLGTNPISSQQWSTTLIQNLEAVQRTLSVEFFSTGGVKVGSTYSVVVPGNGSVGLNLYSGVNLPAQALTDLGTNFTGGMVVSAPSGSKLLGVTNIFYEAPGSPAPAGSREQGSAYVSFPATP